jgi:O-antigen/teichoic acid export membrane protein
VVWSTLNAGFSILFPFVMFVVFSRIVPPWQIGVTAFALAGAELIKALCPQGLYETLLRPETTPEQDRAAFGWLLLAGAAGCAVFVLFVGAVGAFWADLGRMRGLVASLGLKVLFDLALIQPQAVLARRTAFRLLAVRAIGANLLAGGAALLLVDGFGPVWGMVGYYAAQSALAFACTALGARALPRPSLDLSALRALMREAGFASGVRFVAAVNNYLDQLLIAAFVPARLLAEFNLAKRVENTLITTAGSLSGVLFQPAFAVQQPELRARLLAQGRAAITALCALPVAVFVVDHRSVVAAVFGPQWLPAAPAAALMAVSGLARVYGSLNGSMLSVTGRNDALFRWAAVMAAGGMAAVALAGPEGVLWVAAALAVKNVLGVLWQAELTRSEQTRPLLLQLTDVLLPFLAMVAAAAAGVRAAAGLTPHGLHARAAVEVLAAALPAGVVCLAFTRRRLLTLVPARKPVVAQGAAPCA